MKCRRTARETGPHYTLGNRQDLFASGLSVRAAGSHAEPDFRVNIEPIVPELHLLRSMILLPPISAAWNDGQSERPATVIDEIHHRDNTLHEFGPDAGNHVKSSFGRLTTVATYLAMREARYTVREVRLLLGLTAPSGAHA